MAAPPEPEPEPETADLTQLSVDDVVRHLIPDVPELAQVAGLASPPRPEGTVRLLTDGYDATRGADGLLRLRSSTQLSGSRRSLRGRPQARSRDAAVQAAEHARQRLGQSRKRGGFVAVKTSVAGAPMVIDRLALLDGVT